MVESVRDRKPGVVGAMHLIRPLFLAGGHDVTRHSDGDIADALLETCPTPTDFWLRDDHIRLAFKRLQETGTAQK